MAGKQCSGIINLLFDGFSDNTRGQFTRCSHFSSPLRGSEKYDATLKVYIFYHLKAMISVIGIEVTTYLLSKALSQT